MKLLLLLQITLLGLAVADLSTSRPGQITALWPQDGAASNPPLPAAEGVFFLQDAKYLELTKQAGKGVDIGRLAQKRMAKFSATVTLPGKPAKFAISERRPAFLIHLPGLHIEENFKLMQLLGGEVAGQSLFVVSGYSGTVPVLSSSPIRKAIAYQTEKRGDDYLVLKPKSALAPGFYALVDTDPVEPRVWAFSIK